MFTCTDLARAKHTEPPPCRRRRTVLCREDTPGAARHGWSFLSRTCVCGWAKRNKEKGKALTAHTTRFPAFGLQIHRHDPPTQEKIAIVVGSGNARTVHALAPLLEHGDFTVRPEALVSIAKHGRRCQHRGGGRYVGRLRQRGPSFVLRLWTRLCFR